MKMKSCALKGNVVRSLVVHLSALFLLSSVADVAPLPNEVDGIYPHLAMFNGEGECGTGAVVPWAGSLWAVTYGPHCPNGSSDKLYEIKPDLTRVVRSESVGGTPANRMIHRESHQLIIGPYFIDAKGNVRVIPPARMPGRLTATARHLTDPANKVYMATMDSGLYEVDVHTLAVKTLLRDHNGEIGRIWGNKEPMIPLTPDWASARVNTLPGSHTKGMCTGFGRIQLANNGEYHPEAKTNPWIPAGVLGDCAPDGSDQRVIRRCQFTDITTRDGIYGNEHPARNPVWSLGWDAKSVILAVTTNGTAWTYYRLPKASHCYDGAHGWNTEWPRIRDVGFVDGTLLATMHGTFWKFPADFSPAKPNGIRPLSTYLKVIGDFCRWGERIVFGCDDQAMSEFLGTRTLKKGAPKRDRSQSNLWFVKPEDLTSFGPPSGEGWVWRREDVKAGDISDPYLYAGYDVMDFTFTDADGKHVPYELLRDGDWVRVKSLADAKGVSAHFVYGPKRPAEAVRPVGAIDVYDDYSKKTYSFPNVNGDTTVICREVATERDLLYVGGVFYEVPADNAGGFAELRPIALADEPVRSIEARLGLVFVNGKPMALDSLWKNGTAAKAYWLWRNRNALHGRITPPMRITEENFAGDESRKAWRATAWRNERVHATVALWGADVGLIEADPVSLRGPDGAQLVGKVRWMREVDASWFFHGTYDAKTYPRFKVGDILDDAQPFSLTPGGYRGVWVSFRTGVETMPGTYRGSLRVRSSGGTQEFPLEMEVLSAELPRRKRFHLDIWQTPWTISRYYGVRPFSPEHYARMEPIFRELADAGQNVITTTITDYPWNVRANIDSARSMVRYVRRRDGSYHADFSVMDGYVAFAEKCGIGPQIHCYALVKFERNENYQCFDEATGKDVSIRLPHGSPEYEAYWGPLLSQLEAHARAKGWIGRLYMAMDELSPAEVRSASRLMAKYAPTLKLQMAGNRNPADFRGVRIDSFSQELTRPAFFSKDFLDEVKHRRSEGLLTTIYVCCNPRRPNCLVVSPLVEQRWLGLFIAQTGFDGFLKSTSHRWMTGTDPLSDSHCLPHFPCGDSFLFYPGPLFSPRWESLVDGFEDCEKISILRAAGCVTPELEAALGNIDYARFAANDTRQCRRDVSAVLSALEAAARKLPVAR